MVNEIQILKDFIKARNLKFTYSMERVKGRYIIWFDGKNEIRVRRTLSLYWKFIIITHELGHWLHCIISNSFKHSKRTRELRAELYGWQILTVLNLDKVISHLEYTKENRKMRISRGWKY